MLINFIKLGFYCCNSSYLLGELFVTNQHLAFNLLSTNMEEHIIIELNDIQGFEAVSLTIAHYI